jgi:4,5-DOPA dioxygenase extradiol
MNRIEFLKTLGLAPFIKQPMQLSELKNITDQFSSSKKTPLLFIGHGHPMNAILNERLYSITYKTG